jgi:hypothetical protein
MTHEKLTQVVIVWHPLVRLLGGSRHFGFAIEYRNNSSVPDVEFTNSEAIVCQTNGEAGRLSKFACRSSMLPSVASLDARLVNTDWTHQSIACVLQTACNSSVCAERCYSRGLAARRIVRLQPTQLVTGRPSRGGSGTNWCPLVTCSFFASDVGGMTIRLGTQ